MLQTQAKIIQNKRVKLNYFHCILKAPAIAKSVSPGQFVNIKVSDGFEPLLRRPLSIHKATGHRPQATGQIEIFYEVLGKGTEILSQRKPGEYLDLIGPLGNGFDLQFAACNLQPILVAGGMGIAPLLFLAEKLMTYDLSLITVLIGAKTKGQILCEKEFRNLGCSVKVATDNGSKGFKGKVTELLEKILATSYKLQASGKNPAACSMEPVACSLQPAATIYACGPRPMLKEINKISKNYNIPAQISLEEHLACGIGACLGCAVKTIDGYQRVCKEGPVFLAEELIW